MKRCAETHTCGPTDTAVQEHTEVATPEAAVASSLVISITNMRPDEVQPRISIITLKLADIPYSISFWVSQHFADVLNLPIGLSLWTI